MLSSICCGCYRELFFSKALNFHECFSLNIGLIGVTYLILLSLRRLERVFLVAIVFVKR